MGNDTLDLLEEFNRESESHDSSETVGDGGRGANDLAGLQREAVAAMNGLTDVKDFPAVFVGLARRTGLRLVLLKRWTSGLQVFLEENIARTTASVGESLVAGAIFTIPAFLIAKNPTTGEPIWETVHYWESTLLMLVCAFGGRDFVMKAYRKAVRDKYRFFSYGDAMLIR